jgi:hypothetical protein
MTRRTITGVVMVLTTVAAAMVIWFWALGPLGFASYLTSPGASDADIIRQYWPNRLVQPEWVNTTPDRLINWHLTETAARLAVVAVLWPIVAVGVAFGFVRGQRRKNGSRQFNHTAAGRISNLYPFVQYLQNAIDEMS